MSPPLFWSTSTCIIGTRCGRTRTRDSWRRNQSGTSPTVNVTLHSFRQELMSEHIFKAFWAVNQESFFREEWVRQDGGLPYPSRAAKSGIDTYTPLSSRCDHHEAVFRKCERQIHL